MKFPEKLYGRMNEGALETWEDEGMENAAATDPDGAYIAMYILNRVVKVKRSMALEDVEW